MQEAGGGGSEAADVSPARCGRRLVGGLLATGQKKLPEQRS
jgi:hypothetical protein